MDAPGTPARRPRGGRRPGAGAPRGNTNALLDGQRSYRAAFFQEASAIHPNRRGLKRLFYILGMLRPGGLTPYEVREAVRCLYPAFAEPAHHLYEELHAPLREPDPEKRERLLDHKIPFSAEDRADLDRRAAHYRATGEIPPAGQDAIKQSNSPAPAEVAIKQSNPPAPAKVAIKQSNSPALASPTSSIEHLEESPWRPASARPQSAPVSEKTMPYEAIDYTTDGALARITLNRPERLNAINTQLVADLRASVVAANDDAAVRVIILSGAGRAFCAGYDLDWGTRAEDAGQRAMGGAWDPVRDYLGMSRNVRAYMSLWESPKPVIAQVHGWCVGGGTDLALCSDLIFMADDAQIGYPPARVWGEPTTMMWVYRLGLEHAKRLMLTGGSLTGTEAEHVGLCSKALPASQLADHVDNFARKLATIPLNQLAMSKLLVNQAYENMGLRTTQMLGTVFDGVARHTPEGIAWRDMAMKDGFREAVRRRDAPFEDYGERKK